MHSVTEIVAFKTRLNEKFESESIVELYYGAIIVARFVTHYLDNY